MVKKDTSNILTVENLSVNYSGIKAVRGVTFSVKKNQKIAIIGANGAGKTTLMKALVGLKEISGGAIYFNGQSIAMTPAFKRVEQGITLVPEGRGIFSRLTVEENLLLGAYLRPNSELKEVYESLENQFYLFPRLKERRNQLAGTLSGGEQQMLAIARALMGKPKLLLLDEPSMGLAPILVEQIFKVLEDITSQDISLLLVEQNASLALTITEEAIVLDLGKVVMQGHSKQLLSDKKVQEAYLGI
tara:strand:- start:21302 stop:22036 length:735 start_codon:yes stop_codon:yes gene_type:complete